MTRLRRAGAWVQARRVPWATLSWLLLVVMVAYGFHTVNRLIAEEAHEEAVEEAVECVNTHRRYHVIRSVIEHAATVGAQVGTDTHVEILGGVPADYTHAHEVIARRMPVALAPVLDLYDAPTCDLDASRALVAEEDRP